MKKDINQRLHKINIGEVPKGYKKTKLGIAPNEWKVKKLSEIAKVVERKNDGGEHPVLTISSLGGFLDQSQRFSKVIAGRNLANYTLLEKNEFAYNKGNSKSYPYGCIFKLDGYDKAVIPNVYYCFCISEEHDDFYKHYFFNGMLNKQLRRIINTGVRNDGLLNIYAKDFFDTLVFIPLQVEQIRISNMLNSFDQAIDLKERLIIYKKVYKKGLMKNLLTKKIRLNGFEKAWKQIKLGKVLKERKETGYNDLELLAITMANGVCRREGLDLIDNSSKDKSKYKRILPLDIGYNTMRMWQGVSGVSEYEGIISPAYTVLKPTDEIDSYFIGYLFQLPRVIHTFRRYSQGLVKDTLSLKYENFKGIKLSIPSDINEQRAIAKILRLQDKEINLLIKEVELLKEQKKGLMQLLLTGKVRVKC